jgi:hypothetical protein
MAGLCLACCLAASAAAQGAPAAKADFSGTWVLDASKSEGLPPGVEQTLVVTQQGDRVEAQNTTKGPQGEQVIKDAYVLDGQETDFAPALVGGGTGKGRRTSRWTADGRAFDVTEQATVPGDDGEEQIKATRRWSLSADAKTLTIEITLNGPMGEYKSTSEAIARLEHKAGEVLEFRRKAG